MHLTLGDAEFQGQLQLVFGETKLKDKVERAKIGVNLFSKILEKDDWKTDVHTFNLAGKLYKLIKRSKERRDACKEIWRGFKARYARFPVKEMPRDIRKLEKEDKDHPNGTHMLSLKKKGKSSKKARKSVKEVEYFRESKRISRMATFTDEGKILLPKRLKGSKELMYVVDKYGHFYVGKETSGSKVTKHSSFLSGRAVAGAGSIKLSKRGRVKEVNNNSGHYCPGKDELRNTVRALALHGVALDRLRVSEMGRKRKLGIEWV